MNMLNRWNRPLAAAALALGAAGLATPAAADTIFNTGTPDPGWLGYYGWDISVGQSVTIAFTPTQDYTLDTLGLWLMSNDFNGPGATLTVSLQTNAGGGAPVAPSGTVLESWDTATGAVGWVPELLTVTSGTHTVLNAGSTYWIVAESAEAGGEDPVWVVAPGDGSSYYQGNIDFNSGSAWQIGASQAPLGAVVTATPVPEPGTAASLLTGMLMLGGWLRARRG